MEIRQVLEDSSGKSSEIALVIHRPDRRED